MIRAIGMMQGLRGDLCMSTVAARSFKQQHPDSYLTLGLNQRFEDLAPLFHDHPYFDAVHVYKTYDGWPGPEDRAYLSAAKYDCVFHAMPQHLDARWWEYRHQYAECCHQYELPIPENLQPTMNRWFHVDAYPDTIAIAPFGGNGDANDKAFRVAQAQDLVDLLCAAGWKVVHLGAPNEPDLAGAVRPRLCYFDAVRLMLGCRMLIHCDTGLGHFAGAYNHPSFGIYGYRYYGEDKVKQIQPVHPEFHCYKAPVMAEISMQEVWPHILQHLTP